MNWQNVLSIRLLDQSLIKVEIGVPIIILFVAWFVIFLLSKNRWRRLFEKWKVEKANIKLGGVGEISIKPDFEDIQIAHKAWVELATRKAGITFNEEYDVIIEIYDSWYKLFSEMRELTKQIPADRIRSSEDTQELVKLLVDALNNGLRPHLTKWQAKFRRWYTMELQKHPNKSPQEIQALYPDYKDLIRELKEVNKQMVEYTRFVKRISHGA